MSVGLSSVRWIAGLATGVALSTVALPADAAAAGGDVARAVRMLEPADDRGAGFVRERYGITLPYARIDYRVLRRSDASQATVEKYGDHALGLEFGRRVGNGGWDLWKFLAVRVRTDDGRLADGTALFPARSVCVLEAGERTMAELVWPLAPTTPEAELAVRFLQNPGLADWLFLEVKVNGTTLPPDTVRLSCFPGNTAGPVLRERWVFSGGAHHTLHQGAVRLPPPAGAVLYYNRYAQERDGCQLVWLPEEVAAVSVNGTYGVETLLKPAAGRLSLHLALGYFRDTARDDAVRAFAGETPDQVRLLLRATSWQPTVDRDSPKQTIARVRALLAKEPIWPDVPGAEQPLAGRRCRQAEGAPRTWGERCTELEGELAAVRADGRERELVQAAAAAAALQQAVYEEALSLLR